MKTKIIAIVAALLLIGPAQGQDNLLGDLTLTARLGYSLGGTAPVGLPATIRKLEKFPLTTNYSIGVDAQKPLAGQWGLMTGLHWENKGMSTDAKVKNYHMEIVRGGESLEGVFTGNVVTKVEEFMFTVPIQATYNIKNVCIKCGPFFSYLTYRRFYGWAYNGYLRVGDPTGPKVELGEGENERGSYEFSPHMRKVQFGIDLGADWMLSRKFGLYADLSWGLQGVHKSDFKTIEQTLYPIFGTIGVIYRIK